MVKEWAMVDIPSEGLHEATMTSYTVSKATILVDEKTRMQYFNELP